MRYQVRAFSSEQTITQIVVDARDEADARRQVESRGLYPTKITRASRSLLGNAKGGRKQVSLVLFSQELLALLEAGLSIVEGLEALLEKETNESARSVFSRLLSGLREGKRFSAVLADQPDLFPPLYVGIVKAAEGTSDLPRSLARFVDYQQRIDSVRSKIISAAIYPVILLLVGGGVTFFLVGYVVPRFAEVYQGAGRNLPWLSQLLLDWGQFVSAHTMWVGMAALVGLMAAVVGLRTLFLQGGAGRLLNRIPGIAERARIYELSRLYLTLGMLLEGGIPIVPAMDTLRGIVSPGIRQSLMNARAAIESGTPLSISFERNGLTTPISLRMLRVGERSGELGRMLTQSASFYDGEIGRWIDRFTRTFEPLLMAGIGIVVGAIVVLLYMPIFDLAGSLS